MAGLYQSSLNLSSQEHAEILTYDLNGNIKTLKRSAYDFGTTTTNLIDHLKYDYHGNRLLSIVDNPNGTPNPSGYEGGGNTIAYDDNGNMTDMLDKGIENIEYNFLNLPNQIDIVDG